MSDNWNDRLRDEARRLGWTLQELARAGGRPSRSTSMSWLSGARQPTMAVLCRLGEAGIDIPYVMFGGRPARPHGIAVRDFDWLTYDLIGGWTLHADEPRVEMDGQGLSWSSRRPMMTLTCADVGLLGDFQPSADVRENCWRIKCVSVHVGHVGLKKRRKK